MVYNNDIKKWEHAGGSQGISEVHVYHNQSNNNYRIVGRKLNDREVRIHATFNIRPAYYPTIDPLSPTFLNIELPYGPSY